MQILLPRACKGQMHVKPFLLLYWPPFPIVYEDTRAGTGERAAESHKCCSGTTRCQAEEIPFGDPPLYDRFEGGA